MDSFFAFVIAAFVLSFFMLRYMKDQKKQHDRAREAAEKGKLRSDGPQAQHPHIDVTHCIGCGACTSSARKATSSPCWAGRPSS